MSVFRLFAALPAAVLLPACANLPADWGRGEVRAQLQARGLSAPEAPPPAEFQAQLLASPLDLDRVIQIGLLYNPELRSRYAALGFAAADLDAAGRLSNPLLSVSTLSAGGAPQAQLSLGIALNFTELLFRRSRRHSAQAEFAAEKARVGGAALDLAAELEAAYRRCAAAAQLLQLRQTLAEAASASAELAARYQQAGTLKRGELALQQAASAQAAVQLQDARLDLALSRNALQRLMGLGAAAEPWSLAEPLAALPPQDPSLAQLQTRAASARLDLQAAAAHLQAVQTRLGTAAPQAVLAETQIGVEHQRDYDGSRHTGPSLQIPLPLLNPGRAARARAEAELAQAQSQLESVRLDLQQQLADADARLRSSRARVERFRDELIPAREAAFESLQREHNYMLIGTFELLVARQQSFEAYAGYVEALRDYWLARAELSRAVGQRLPETAAPAAQTPAEAPPAAASHDHPDDPPHEHDHGALQP